MLRNPNEAPLAGNNSLAIAIAGSSITGDRRQRHVAFLYRHESKALMLLHLGWHELVIYESWPAAHYAWLEISGIDPEVQETFVDWVEIVAIASQDGTSPVPYSAHFRPSGNFDENGHYINKHDGTGLTCATFILAMFADFQLPLIDTSTWPRRPDDFSWFRRMWRRLRKRLERIDLILQFNRRQELRRYRPEEVAAAAAIFSGAPLAFDVVTAQVDIFEPSLPD